MREPNKGLDATAVEAAEVTGFLPLFVPNDILLPKIDMEPIDEL